LLLAWFLALLGYQRSSCWAAAETTARKAIGKLACRFRTFTEHGAWGAGSGPCGAHQPRQWQRDLRAPAASSEPL